MGDGFDDAGVESEGGADQVLAVARDAASPHDGFRSRRAASAEQLAQSPLRRADRIAVVGCIVCEEYLPAIVESGDLGRRGAGVDAERHLYLARGNRYGGKGIPAPFGLPCGKLLRALEKLRQRPVSTAVGSCCGGDMHEPFVCRPGRGIAGRECRAPRGHQLGIVGTDDLFLVQMQILFECFAQRGEKRQRAAAEKYRSLDVAAVRERNDGLYRDGMENRCGDILAAYVAGQQILDVRLGEDPAP